MLGRSGKRLALVAILLGLAAGTAGAETLDEAIGRWRSGHYGDAEAAFEKLLATGEETPRVAAAFADLLLELGRFEEAEEIAGRGGADGACLTVAAESRLLRGDLEKAGKLLDAALEASPDRERARYLRGMLHLARGERKEALSAFDWFFEHYAGNDVVDPEALTYVAAATVRAAELQPDVAMDFHVTMKLLDTIVRDHPEHLPAYIVAGDLYLSAFEDQSAKKYYQNALKQNPRYPPAHLGLAKQRNFRFNQVGGIANCREALLTNPNLFEAKEYIARTRINDSQYEEAREILEEVLAVNPRRKPARALIAAMEFCLGRREVFEEKVGELLEEDGRYAQVYRELVQILEQQRRFEEAAAWAERATETDPDDSLSWWLLGRNLVHLAREEPAKEALSRSRRIDPFGHYRGNVFRENLHDVLEHLEEFVTTRSPHFVYKIHVGENAILTRYLHRFMEKSYALLTEKYGFEPEGPVLTEVFHKHEDFAARTIGLPGIGALGACFGKVITLDSPSARKAGAFVWASTAHHEFAHVITLQLSKGRVPRWFTEGLSVYEERQYTDWWERDLDRRLFDAYMNDEIHGIAGFNGAFRGGDVLFAYYLGGMMCEFMTEEFGWDKIRAMLVAYGEDKQTREVLSEVLGVSLVEYDERFKEWVGKLVTPWKMVPRWSRKTLRKNMAKIAEDPQDVDALLTAAWAHFQRGNTVDARNFLGKALKIKEDDPRAHLLRGELAFRSRRFDKAKEWLDKFLAAGGDALAARLHLAQILEQERDYEGAMAQLEAAKRCFPSYAGEKNPYLELARLKEGEEDLAGAMREIESFVKLANTDIEHRLELADYYENEGEQEKLVEILEQVVLIYPLGEKLAMPVHVRLARAYAERGDLQEAELEYEVALDLGVPPEEEARVRVGLGEIYYLEGKLEEARFQAGSALEADPENEPARELLEKASR